MELESLSSDSGLQQSRSIGSRTKERSKMRKLSEMSKSQYQFTVTYCKLQENGYKRCDAGQDCKACEIAKKKWQET